MASKVRANTNYRLFDIKSNFSAPPQQNPAWLQALGPIQSHPVAYLTRYQRGMSSLDLGQPVILVASYHGGDRHMAQC